MDAKILKVVVALALGLAMLTQSATASGQANSSTFEQAEGPDDACELQLIAGGPYDVSIGAGPVTVYENGSVVSVPQGSSVNYMRSERTLGFTAVGVNERCAMFAADNGSDDVGADLANSDDAASADEATDENSPSAEQPAELAVTGAETPLLAIGGVALVAAGLQLIVFCRRQD